MCLNIVKDKHYNIITEILKEHIKYSVKTVMSIQIKMLGQMYWVNESANKQLFLTYHIHILMSGMNCMKNYPN